MFSHKAAESSTHLADQAAQSAEHVVRSSKEIVNNAIDNVASSVRDTSRQLQTKVLRASDGTVNYIRDEPVKSVLIAAAAGAAIVALATLVQRSRARN